MNDSRSSQGCLHSCGAVGGRWLLLDYEPDMPTGRSGSTPAGRIRSANVTCFLRGCVLPDSFVGAASRKLWLAALVDALLAGQPWSTATLSSKRLTVAVHNLGVGLVPHDVEIDLDSRVGLR